MMDTNESKKRKYSQSTERNWLKDSLEVRYTYVLVGIIWDSKINL